MVVSVWGSLGFNVKRTDATFWTKGFGQFISSRWKLSSNNEAHNLTTERSLHMQPQNGSPHTYINDLQKHSSTHKNDTSRRLYTTATCQKIKYTYMKTIYPLRKADLFPPQIPVPIPVQGIPKKKTPHMYKNKKVTVDNTISPKHQ